MRALGLAAGLILYLALSSVGSATAAEQKVSQQLQVSARILPSQIIIIDVQNRILQIASNSTDEVTPKVYLNQALRAYQVPLTEEVYQQYRGLIPTGTVRVGVLYKRSSIEAVNQFQQELVNLASPSQKLVFKF